MKLVELNQISQESVNTLTASFDRLPYTNHKDGKYRLRRYSAVEMRTTFWNAKREIELMSLGRTDFTQSEEWNAHQGGMTRSFEPIEDEVLQSKGMKDMCALFKDAYELIDGQEIEIHQLRVRTLEGEPWTQVAPEGVHQDGYHYIAMIGINRHNIEGGELMAYVSKDSDPFLKYALEDGQMLILNDKELWHNATPIKRNTATVGYGDWFVLCAKKVKR